MYMTCSHVTHVHPVYSISGVQVPRGTETEGRHSAIKNKPGDGGEDEDHDVKKNNCHHEEDLERDVNDDDG